MDKQGLGASAFAETGSRASVKPASGLAPTGFDPARVPYENTLTIDELRREVRQLWDREASLTRDLKDLPEVPSIGTMYLLAYAAVSHRGLHASERGKALQRKCRATARDSRVDCFDFGNGGVPYKAEYEWGAGLWTVIQPAIAAAAREGGDAKQAPAESPQSVIAQPPSGD